MITVDLGLATLLERGLISLHNFCVSRFRAGSSREAINQELSNLLRGKDLPDNIDQIIDDAERYCRDAQTIQTTGAVRKMVHTVRCGTPRYSITGRSAVKKSGKKSAKKSSRKAAKKMSGRRMAKKSAKRSRSYKGSIKKSAKRSMRR